MSLNIETIDAIKNVFKKPPHNIGHHTYKFNVSYGHVEFENNSNGDTDDDHIDKLENKVYELMGYLDEIAHLANVALSDEVTEKDDLLDVLTEILILAE